MKPLASKNTVWALICLAFALCPHAAIANDETRLERPATDVSEVDSAATSSIKTIQWSDLAPEGGKPFSDPFAKLTQDQLVDLGIVMRVRRLIAEEKISPDGRDAKEVKELAQKLAQQGVDIPWLMVQRDRVLQIRGLQVKSVAESIGQSLRDTTISLTGYAIPCTTDDQGLLREFFLVPTVAACSHEDAPPRLQVVFVSTTPGIDRPLRSTPVRVTGKIVAEATARPTINASGRVVIHAAYAMSSPSIESGNQP